MRKVIIEVGSTNTKCYVSENNILKEDHFETLQFKRKYLENKIIDAELFDKLIEIVNRYKDDNVYVFGTSIFRIMDNNNREIFLNDFYAKTNRIFNILSIEDEGYHIVKSIINDNSYNDNICVLVTGSSSTEVTFVNRGNIISNYNFEIGSLDVINNYPYVLDEIVNEDYNVIANKISKQFKGIKEKANILILAGSNHLYYYNLLKYPLVSNTLYESKLQTKMIGKRLLNKYDKLFFKTPLDNFRDLRHYDSFIGNRAIRLIISAINKQVKSNIIIPTYITTSNGIDLIF